MEISSTEQTFVFLAALCFGAVLGAVYDVFRVFRVAVPCGKVGVFFQDVLFWLLCAVSSFLFLLCFNTGVVRAFVLLGELLGATLYYFTLGVLVMRSAKAIVGLFRRVFRALGRWTLRPLRALGRLIRAGASKTVRFAKKPCKDLHTHLQSRFRVVYNLGNHRKNGARKRRKPNGKRRRKRRKRKGSSIVEKTS